MHLLAKRQHSFPLGSNFNAAEAFLKFQVGCGLHTPDPLLLLTFSVPKFGPNLDFQSSFPNRDMGCLRELPHSLWLCLLTTAVIHLKISVSREIPMSAADGRLLCCWLVPQELAAAWSQMNASLHIFQGRRHVTVLPAHQWNASIPHTAPSVEAAQGSGLSHWCFAAARIRSRKAEGHASDKKLFMGREGMDRKNNCVSHSSSSLLVASLACYMGGGKVLVVDSYAIGFLV